MGGACFPHRDTPLAPGPGNARDGGDGARYPAADVTPVEEAVPSAQTVIRARALIDGTDSPPVGNAVVVVEGCRVVAAGPEEAVEAPRGPGVKELTFPDGYLLPGLIDAHTHLMFGAGDATYEEVIERDSDEVMLLRAARNAHIHLSAGVTTLRDCGARNQVTFDLRRGVRQGLALAPRLLLSGRPVTVTGGHFWWCNGEADGVEGVRKAVRRLVRDGADFIKIMASGGGTAGTDNRRPSYSVEELRAIVDEAHALGKPTTAHCIATQSIVNALDSGVDSIEHATFIEPDGSYRFNPRIAERIARQGVLVSPTVQTGYRKRERLLQKREQGHALTPEERHRLEDLHVKCEKQVEFLGRLWSDWEIPDRGRHRLDPDFRRLLPGPGIAGPGGHEPCRGDPFRHFGGGAGGRTGPGGRNRRAGQGGGPHHRRPGPPDRHPRPEVGTDGDAEGHRHSPAGIDRSPSRDLSGGWSGIGAAPLAGETSTSIPTSAASCK